MFDLSDISSSSSSSDEENIVQRIPRRRRALKDRTNPFELYDEQEFKMRFRFNKETILWLRDILGAELEPTCNRRKSISALNQVLLTMRFLATGAFQQLVGDTFGVHKSTACIIIQRVVRKIAALKPQYIKMPTQAELQNVKLGFYRLRRMPNVIGAIDCSHIRIESPGGLEAEVFRNRKNYFSINIQAVCDANIKILNIVARWPGSVHDSTIFNDSALCADLENSRYGDGFLLGDSGYACRSFILTPLIRPQTAPETAYNNCHKATRNPIERCFGVLKKRFPCLSIGLRTKMETTLTTIVACCVLHNLAIIANDEEPPRDPEIVLPPEVNEIHVQNNVRIFNNENSAVRTSLIRTHFG
ncbi:hypothetical protein Zmor_001020 [Zophobas morio]|uniref:DDE Tnp4 domain-containing protein n=1 Tax=Zophobas morio TaxID=2755281 RepID=A0AA38MSA3_9CUCU|nr:hypothetical protein Zmor_001020 [Zophobas morio]